QEAPAATPARAGGRAVGALGLLAGITIAAVATWRAARAPSLPAPPAIVASAPPPAATAPPPAASESAAPAASSAPMPHASAPPHRAPSRTRPAYCSQGKAAFKIGPDGIERPRPECL